MRCRSVPPQAASPGARRRAAGLRRLQAWPAVGLEVRRREQRHDVVAFLFVLAGVEPPGPALAIGNADMACAVGGSWHWHWQWQLAPPQESSSML